jgi:hypothetical protein
MLFIHTQKVIQRQKSRKKEENMDEEDGEGIDIEENDL